MEEGENGSDTQKKGDVEDVGNYRPICSLPALYKLFTTILFSRLYPRLDQNQAEDQAGFPICSLPALYKLFTTILFSRLYPRLDQKSSGRSGGIQKPLPNWLTRNATSGESKCEQRQWTS